MISWNTTSKLTAYVRHNWFKIGIVVVLVIILVKKDLTFNINLRSPVRSNVPQHKESKPAPQSRKEKSKEVLTDNASQPIASTAPKQDLFDVSFFGKKSRQSKSIEQLNQVEDAIKQAYLKRFARVAVSESAKFNIPASIILANALLQSQAGTSDAAQRSNNQFALLCTPDWQAEKYEFDGNCYRKYENAWTSFRDHSFYITTGSFASLRKLDRTNFKAWANALEKANFSKEKDYAKQLIQVIEQYELSKLDE
ncbi:MAG: glucosaminidase domain-containing protein [Saprospiraceae bacterium]|nr:glucosaminidase domain-containing protein [Saprospiraceae bacterium]